MIDHCIAWDSFGYNNGNQHIRGRLKKWGATTMESSPQYILFTQSFVFSRENYKLHSVLSVLSCYITCIAHTFHINGI